MGEGLIVRRGTPVFKELVFLYDSGNEFVGTTGGWVVGYSSGNGTLIKNTDNLNLIVTNNPSNFAERVYVTNNTMDLSTINRLYIEWEQTETKTASNYGLLVDTNKTGTSAQFTVKAQFTMGTSRRVDSLDVSSLTGNFYIRLHAIDGANTSNNDVNLKVYRIWGEK